MLYDKAVIFDLDNTLVDCFALTCGLCKGDDTISLHSLDRSIDTMAMSLHSPTDHAKAMERYPYVYQIVASISESHFQAISFLELRAQQELQYLRLST